MTDLIIVTQLPRPFRGSRPSSCRTKIGVFDRQINLLNRLADGFEGKLTSSKWAAIAKCSQDTALRDITELLERGVLRKSEASGRSTRYDLSELG